MAVRRGLSSPLTEAEDVIARGCHWPITACFPSIKVPAGGTWAEIPSVFVGATVRTDERVQFSGRRTSELCQVRKSDKLLGFRKSG
jgi:hypothetical protein